MTRRLLIPFIAAFALALVGALAGHPAAVTPAHAATCSQYSTQAAAQRAHDTRDADGDGRYCESLPCPCATGGGSTSAPTPPPSSDSGTSQCVRPRGVVPLGFSATKYPHIRDHYLRAVRRGWPRILVLDRPGAGERRDRLLAPIPTRAGMDRDEYPPAVGRGKGAHLVRGSDPRGWEADVAYVPSSENRSQGAVMGFELRRYCDGTRFRYAFH